MKTMKNKLKTLKISIRFLSLILLGGLFMLTDTADIYGVPGVLQQEPYTSVQIKSNDVTILMSDRAKFNGGMKVYYPGPFEQMGKALKAGNSDRLIAYNSWVLPRFTEFQDFFFGEGNEKCIDGAGPKGGNGIVANGPQKGLQGFANFIVDGPNWGISRSETKINPPIFTKDQITTLVNNAKERKLAMSFNLLMYEDGSVSPESLEMMKYVRTIFRGK